MKPIFTVFIFSIFIGNTACQKCQECTLTRTQNFEGSGTQSSSTINEYCGKTLDDIEANKSYSKNGVLYNWTCEK